MKPTWEYEGSRWPDGGVVTVRLAGTSRHRASSLPKYGSEGEFGWGDLGENSRRLARSLLRHHFDDPVDDPMGVAAEAAADDLADAFLAEVVARMVRSDWAADSEMVEAWVRAARVKKASLTAHNGV